MGGGQGLREIEAVVLIMQTAQGYGFLETVPLANLEPSPRTLTLTPTPARTNPNPNLQP